MSPAPEPSRGDPNLGARLWVGFARAVAQSTLGHELGTSLSQRAAFNLKFGSDRGVQYSVPGSASGPPLYCASELGREDQKKTVAKPRSRAVSECRSVMTRDSRSHAPEWAISCAQASVLYRLLSRACGQRTYSA